MNKALLLRLKSTAQGTPGSLYIDNLILHTMELPFRDNIKQISCIPEGSYICKWIKSPKFGWTYQVTNVSGRGNILIHSGNFAGNKDMGFKTNSHGCILPCEKLGKMDGVLAGLISRPAVRKLNEAMKMEPFLLSIRNT